MAVAAFETAQDTGGNSVNLGTASPGWLTFTVPAGKNFVMWNITNDGQAVTTYDQCGIAPGASIPRSFAFHRGMDVSTLLSAPVLESAVLEDYSFNMIDPSKVDFTRRYSTGTRTFIMKDVNLIAQSD